MLCVLKIVPAVLKKIDFRGLQMDVTSTQSRKEVIAIAQMVNIGILNQGSNDRDRCALKKYLAGEIVMTCGCVSFA